MIRSWRIAVCTALSIGIASLAVAESDPAEQIADALIKGLRDIEHDSDSSAALDKFLDSLSPQPASVDANSLFESHVRPLLAEHCFVCHGPDKQKGGLRLDTFEALQNGGADGPVIVPGKPDDSRLIQAIRYGDENLQMPPKGKLPSDAIATLTEWVANGAPWPNADADLANLEQAKRDEIAHSEKYWAFRPVTRPAIPETENEEWGTNPIDAFILDALHKRNLEPSRLADRRTLIRRVYLDALGLPPTPEEVEAFVADPDRDAYTKLVDRVLASPRYGERWARHWLDVVRFAETNGFETNTPRRNAWPYRDYVIQSLNDDKPYTDFVREQLAGDALGVVPATGFLVGGPMDTVKSPDIVLTKNQRDGELNDMVSTIGGAFLGLTVGCAKCHDHKFDPISQRDYYRMRAMVAGVQHGEQEIPSPNYAEKLNRAEAARADLRHVKTQLLRFVPKVRLEGDAGEPSRPAVSPRMNLERFDPVSARSVRFTILETNSSQPCIDELEVFSAGPDSTNVALAERGAKATASGEYPNNDKHKIVHLNDGEYGNDHSWIPAEGPEAWAQIEFPETVTIDRIMWARDREGTFSDRLATKYRIEVAVDLGDWGLVASSDDRQPYQPGADDVPLYSAEGMDETAVHELEKLLRTERELKKSIKQLTEVPKVYAGRFEEPGPTHILRRGDPMQEGAEVAPGTPKYVGTPCDLPADLPERERRRTLADWIASPENPLTARVIVNRIWQHHFGHGIVDTPSDFGAMGARPTHPELLDWLASELIAQGWHMKSIHRLILLSSTYRQSATPRPEPMTADAGTRFLWRFPPRRLEAEPIRDSILFVSGKLDLTMGGPGYDAFEPDDSYVHIYVPKQEFGPGDFRRMIYQWKPRVEQDITFGVFDCPDATQTTPKRVSSTSPLQALSLLNSPFMNQQAAAFAQRLKDESGTDCHAQVRRAFLLTFGRPPNDEESRVSEAFVRDEGLAMFCRALYSANEFIYLN